MSEQASLLDPQDSIQREFWEAMKYPDFRDIESDCPSLTIEELLVLWGLRNTKPSSYQHVNSSKTVPNGQL